MKKKEFKKNLKKFLYFYTKKEILDILSEYYSGKLIYRNNLKA